MLQMKKTLLALAACALAAPAAWGNKNTPATEKHFATIPKNCLTLSPSTHLKKESPQ